MKKTAPGIPEIPETTQEAQIVTPPVKAPEKPAVDAGGFCAYIGPTIVGVIQSGTIYPGSVESAKELIAAAIQKYPLIERLIIPGATLAVDRIKAKTPGNRLHEYYKKLATEKAMKEEN